MSRSTLYMALYNEQDDDCQGKGLDVYGEAY